MDAKHYSIRMHTRGEEMDYADGDVQLLLSRTYCKGHRLFCDDTSRVNGPSLPFAKRREIIQNLCDFFDTKSQPTIFVIDERDKDRQPLETLFAELTSEGHKITIEYDSAEKRDQAQEALILRILGTRNTRDITIDGVKIKSIEDYRRLKRRG